MRLVDTPLTRRAPRAITAFLLLPIVGFATDSLVCAAQMPVAAQQDAELADVFFVDADRGWAVGDRGTIWHTSDGGRTWQRQESGVRCRLESVWFIDLQTGWAVGGSSRPYTHTSEGVVLQTENGGRTWRKASDTRLPWLTQVRFFDPRHGFALGLPSAMYPSGLFRTDDAGQTWTQLATPKAKHWLADFRNGGDGLLVAPDGNVVLLQGDRVVDGTSVPCGLKSVRQVRISGQRAWIVADGNQVHVSENGGRVWNEADRLSSLAGDVFDFKTLSVVGDQCWVAGAPGSCVFHSRDGGRNWTVYQTNQTMPIHAMSFIDEHRGWAVGALGTILATRDGGRHWHVQRSGGKRLAMLGLFSQADKIPLELLVRLAGNDGYLATVELLNRGDLETPPCEPVSLPRRAHEAIVAVGGCGAETSWRFPIRQAALQLPAEAIVDGWNGANRGRGVETLEAFLVGKIRQWRPDVIVTEAAGTGNVTPQAHLINQVVLSAVKKAADSSAYADQMSLGLRTWTVKKVIAQAAGNGSATYTLGSAQLALRLGCSLSDLATSAESLIADEYHPSPTSLGFQLLQTQLSHGLAGQDFFSGIALEPVSEARRNMPPATGQSDALRLAAQRQRNITAMVAMSENVGMDSSAMLAQIGALTRGLTPGQAGQTLYQMAWHYRDQSQPDLAAEVATLLLREYPDHRCWDATASWLMRYYASGETTLQLQLAGDAAAQTIQAEARPTSTATSLMQRRALALGRVIAKHRPDLLVEPAICLPLAAAQREAGDSQSAVAHLQSVALHPFGPWSAAARAEFWLRRRNRNNAPPKPNAKCIAATKRPKLDGRLDETVWRNAQPLPLRSAMRDDASWPGIVLLAHDAEYLYLAVHCRKAPGIAYEADDTPRPYDGDLSDHDRVDLLIDIDRDYATYYRLSVDHRGRPNDACFGDETWNPKWYIAADSSPETWTVEAAIEMKRLVQRPPRKNSTWAIGLQRTLPQVGFQSWTNPAAVAPRGEGFGLLMFE